MLKDSIKFDPEKTEKLLQDWKEKLENAQKGHYSQCERLGTINTRIGVALILSSTIVTGFIFYSSSKFAKDSDVFTLVYGVLSIIVAAIPGIVSFSRFSDRATEHRITAGNYGKLRRKLESIATISSDEYHTIILNIN
ncbi:SLATT domain-containing protein [Morganella morganii]|uniref:SLATT domain-containing protein n=1 Tax=Morganella morganii TaxID=582 RepID=UPI0004681965|nr:SLATT domain-containing protein [Morganella morganii]